MSIPRNRFLIHAYETASGIQTEWSIHGQEEKVCQLLEQLIKESPIIKEIISNVINNQNNSKNV